MALYSKMVDSRLLCLTFQIIVRRAFLLPNWQWIMFYNAYQLDTAFQWFPSAVGTEIQTLNGSEVFLLPCSPSQFISHHFPS